MLLPLHIVTSLQFAWDEAIFLAVPGTIALGIGLEKLRMRYGATPPVEGDDLAQAQEPKKKARAKRRRQ